MNNKKTIVLIISAIAIFIIAGIISIPKIKKYLLPKRIDYVFDEISKLREEDNYKYSTLDQQVKQMSDLLKRLEKKGKIKNIKYDNYIFGFDFVGGGARRRCIKKRT